MTKTNDVSKLFEEYEWLKDCFNFALNNFNPNLYAYPSIDIREKTDNIYYSCQNGHDNFISTQELVDGIIPKCKKCENPDYGYITHYFGRYKRCCIIYGNYNRKVSKFKSVYECLLSKATVIKSKESKYIYNNGNKLYNINTTLFQVSFVKCKHSFVSTLSELEANDLKCLVCTCSRKVRDVNTLNITHASLKEHYSERNIVEYSDLTIRSDNQVEWKSERCGHYFKSTPRYADSYFRYNHEFCPVCTSPVVTKGINDLSTMFKEGEKYYSINNELKYDEISWKDKNRLWVCPACGGDNIEMTPKEFHRLLKLGNALLCPYCSDQKVLKGKNDLVTKYKRISNYYSDLNIKTAEETLYNSKDNKIWDCEYCGGAYYATIVRADKGIPKNKRHCCYYNDYLKNSNSIWSKENNYLSSSYKMALLRPKNNYWWECIICGNIYLQSIEEKVLLLRMEKPECPICRNNRFNYFRII